MAVELKFFLIGVSILYGVIYLTTVNGSTADSIDRFSNARIFSDLDSNSNPWKLKLEHTNETRRLTRDISRPHTVYERNIYSATSFLRNADLVRRYFQEEKSRYEDTLRIREAERDGLESLDSNLSRVRFVRRFISPNTERRGRSVDVAFRYDIVEHGHIKRDAARKEFRDSEIRNTKLLESRRTEPQIRRLQRVERNVEMKRRESSMYLRRIDEDFPNERSSRRERFDFLPSRQIFPFSHSCEKYFQFIRDWSSTLHSKIGGMFNCLFTLITGLLVFNTVSQIMPVKTVEEKGFRNFLRRIAFVTTSGGPGTY